MAKPRKQKNEEQKNDNTEAVVRHQKLCLSIDLEKRRIYGYTELEISVPENGIVGLHADNLVIENVTVDGEPAKFEVYPHFLDLDSASRWSLVSSASSASDAAGSVYLSCLDRELVPNLLIMCSKSSKSAVFETLVEPKEGAVPENGTQSSSGEVKQNVKLIHIDYWVEKAETGIHIDANVLHTDNQIRRAGCWFPCIDESSQRCCFDMEFTVAHNLVAVSTGTLLYQVLGKDDPPRKTYVYRLSIPVAARCISLAVAPFEILPDRHSALISHICLPADLSKLRHTVGFLHNAYRHYEHYLSMKFPFGSYTQVFIAPEMAISSFSLGAAMSVFSSQILFDEKIIDQTIDTRIKLAYGLARQWFGVFITAEAPNDEWLLDGLAGFLTDTFIKQFLGNNEARYRRYKANSAVCKADDSAATALSSSESSKDLYGTQCVGFYGKIRAWKSVAILQMLEKQMGPEPFCKILKNIVSPPEGKTRPLRTLSTKEFRRMANDVGNLERPFLREFFPRWVGCSGCPVLKMGFSYNKRKNMVELAISRGCTTASNVASTVPNGNPNSVKREGDVGWPGMMSIRVHELDGMYDHPVLPMAGDTWQLLEIQCHSKFAAKRFQKSKKGPKHDGSDDNDTFSAIDVRSNADSPLLWLRADPETEYLAEIHFNQPVQMWINQLEKDKDVVAQVQAISALELFPHLPSVVSALSNLLSDSQAFWRVRIEAAFSLANTASEENDWAGLQHLIKFYKSRRFDMNIGLPKPNDFHDFAEYFVLEAIPNAIALVRTADKQSPREAVEFILQLLKYNDNNGNPYSDVFWLAALVQAIGELEFGIQSVSLLSSILKRIDRLLQFDRLMASYNGILTVTCIRTLTQIAIKLSEFVPLVRITELIKPFRAPMIKWQVRVEASRALLDLEFYSKGIDAALILFIRYLEEEQSLRGQVKLGVHAMRLCQLKVRSGPDHGVESETLVALLRLLESSVAFNNVFLRHYLFCILQVLAGRPPTLCGVPRDETLRMGHVESCIKNLFADLVEQSKPTEPPMETFNPPYDVSFIQETYGEQAPDANGHGESQPLTRLSEDLENLMALGSEKTLGHDEDSQQLVNPVNDSSGAPNAPIGGDALGGEKTLGHDEESLPLVNPVNDSSGALNALIGRDTLGGEKTLGHDEESQPLGNPVNDSSGVPNAPIEGGAVSGGHEQRSPVLPEVNTGGVSSSDIPEQLKPFVSEAAPGGDTVSNSHEQNKPVTPEIPSVSSSHERKKPVLKIKVKKQSSASSRMEDADNAATVERSQGGYNSIDRGASSSVSMEAPQRNFTETVGISNQNADDVNSCHDVGSRVTASIGSARLASEPDELLQCTAESSKAPPPQMLPPDEQSNDAVTMKIKFASLESLTRNDPASASLSIDNNHPLPKRKKEKEKTKDKDKKRKRDDPEYLEKKRLKKEKKRKEKEKAKLMKVEAVAPPSLDLESKEDRSDTKVPPLLRGEIKASSVTEQSQKEEQLSKVSAGQPGGLKFVTRKEDTNANVATGNSSNKLKIKLKTRTLNKL